MKMFIGNYVFLFVNWRRKRVRKKRRRVDEELAHMALSK
jgi:hypothetical protein